MRQRIGTILIIASLLVLWVESWAQFCGIIKGMPVLRGFAMIILALYVLFQGELNHREYEAKRRKIAKLKEQQKKAAWLAEYEEFRRQHHA